MEFAADMMCHQSNDAPTISGGECPVGLRNAFAQAVDA
jgi:hypothetical protein